MSNSFENLFFYSLTIFFFHYLFNHAEIFDKIRILAFTKLPNFIIGAVQCGFCFSFWTMLVVSIFSGFTINLFAVPVAMLFMDFIFRKIKQ
jgi:MFS family permease